VATTISYSVKLDDELVKRLLILINSDDLSFMELQKKLGLEWKKDEIIKLKLHLYYLEENGWIEERHFEDGTVDYSLEQKGIDLIKENGWG